MLCEDNLMATDKSSPMKKGAGSLNSSASSTISKRDIKPSQYSWAEQIIHAEYGQDKSKSRSSLNNSADSIQSDSKPDSIKIEPFDSSNTLAPTIIVGRGISQEREIAIDFIDSANEQKFERLVKEEKLKTPFKRRHSNTPSNESRSNSPNSSNSDCGSNADASSDGNPRRFFGNSRKDEKRVRHNSHTSTTSLSSYTEADPAVLSRRQKQIDYGKNTDSYDRYVETVPRALRTSDHPRTPNKYGKYSRRAFDGLIKIWRKQLHYYDEPSAKKVEGATSDQSSSDNSDFD